MAAFTAATFLPLSAMANSDAPRHWTYVTADTHAEVVTSGYFNSAAGVLQVNDIVWSVNASGGTQTLTLVLIDAISAAGVVTVVSSVQTLT